MLYIASIPCASTSTVIFERPYTSYPPSSLQKQTLFIKGLPFSSYVPPKLLPTVKPLGNKSLFLRYSSASSTTCSSGILITSVQSLLWLKIKLPLLYISSVSPSSQVYFVYCLYSVLLIIFPQKSLNRYPS